MSDPHRAAVHVGVGQYLDEPPYDPRGPFPEYSGPYAGQPSAGYQGVRNVLALLYPPGDRYGTGISWNPLQELICPGQTVFIKPNLVDHEHRFGGDVWSVITHPSVVRAVTDYVALALRSQGRIIVGDNPHIDCDWNKICDLYRMDRVAERVGDIHGVDVSFVDLRSWHMPDLHNYGWRGAREELAGDPHGEHVIDIRDSYLDEARWWLFRGTFNERMETIRAHRHGHRYSFSNTIMGADTYVSVPKLKSHAKVGTTLNIKGLIGTIINKNSLVHWSIGYPRFGGDEYPDPENWTDYPRLYWQHLVSDMLPSRVQLAIRDRFAGSPIADAYQSIVTTDAQERRLLRGAWDGNDTTWRMTADVHDAFVGRPGSTPRRTLSIIDGIVGGDTDGPHFPHPVSAGAIIGAESLLAADMVATRLMDFDRGGVRYLEALSMSHGVAESDIEVLGCEGDFFATNRTHLAFRPPNRWPHLSTAQQCPAGDFLDAAAKIRRAA